MLQLAAKETYSVGFTQRQKGNEYFLAGRTFVDVGSPFLSDLQGHSSSREYSDRPGRLPVSHQGIAAIHVANGLRELVEIAEAEPFHPARMLTIGFFCRI